MIFYLHLVQPLGAMTYNELSNERDGGDNVECGGIDGDGSTALLLNLLDSQQKILNILETFGARLNFLEGYFRDGHGGIRNVGPANEDIEVPRTVDDMED